MSYRFGDLSRFLTGPRMIGQVRHLVTFAGAVLVYHDVLPQSQFDVYAGLALAAVGFVGSATAREKRND